MAGICGEVVGLRWVVLSGCDGRLVYRWPVSSGFNDDGRSGRGFYDDGKSAGFTTMASRRV